MLAKKTIIMACFSFVNGWVDALCILRYHVFATMMVGNMLSLGPAVSYHWILGQEDEVIPDPSFILLMLAGFMSGVFTYRVLQRGCGLSGKSLAPFVTIWIILHDVSECFFHGTEGGKWNALRLVPLFGMQDAMCVKNGFGSLPWCTTNNIVTLAFGSTDMLLGGATKEEITALRNSAIMFSFMILGTISGGLFGLLFKHKYGFAAMAVPLGCLFWLTPHWLGTPPEKASDQQSVPSKLAHPLIAVDVPDHVAQAVSQNHQPLYRRTTSTLYRKVSMSLTVPITETLGMNIADVESDLCLGG